MPATVFAITPPFTQLNTPYPATAYIKGFLNTKGISCFQADLGIEVILDLFSKQGLTDLLKPLNQPPAMGELSSPILAPPSGVRGHRILALRDDYIQTIDPVIRFLQGKNPTLAHAICQDGFLPEGARFAQVADLDWAFGAMGTHDKAKHLATLYLEDISDFITDCIDPHFGFSRYAERLGRSANCFDELYGALQQDYTYIDQLLVKILAQRMAEVRPQLVAISVPFPGNLYSAFRIGQWIKKHYPAVKIAMGGGFANTELRSLSDVRVFEFFDYITLDDGEAPIEAIIKTLSTSSPLAPNGGIMLKRTFVLENSPIGGWGALYVNNSPIKDYKQSEVGTPDYSDLWLDKYISVIEIVNPMHRMWSDGRWNKLTMAHGCYWGKCTFCDISLDYIKLYEPVAANLLCDRMEEMMAQTGQNGFHFVDEAAPPALMRALALEILRRKLSVTWWTNIRFEKSFSRDLCLLLKASGCIAVSGGLEVASDRLLELIQKGVTVAQVAQVTRNFTEAGIMVHAYLMYGFPTQTAQETIDSLEMVRQMFELGILQSGFWHQFAMTAHSPVGMYPEQFGVQKASSAVGTFANNDIVHLDPTGADHDAFSYGLKKSLLNYMHGICFEYPLQDWFDFKTPRTKVPKNYVENALLANDDFILKPSSKVVWLGKNPAVAYTDTKKGRQATLTFHDKKETFSIKLNQPQADWLCEILALISPRNSKIYTFQELKNHYEAAQLTDFELFWYKKPVATLTNFGLLAL
ncbi:MAG: radical SAM protein [Cytophagia bacterium]|nr:MAG: radical SAM protein [Cytophagales bacterium]TAG37251.1 MAG: radical SAM protein [Cytophagia bacterium]TAG84159.1 MAG: radical SAM protein [Cytophagales bacterium]